MSITSDNDNSRKGDGPPHLGNIAIINRVIANKASFNSQSKKGEAITKDPFNIEILKPNYVRSPFNVP